MGRVVKCPGRRAMESIIFGKLYNYKLPALAFRGDRKTVDTIILSLLFVWREILESGGG